MCPLRIGIIGVGGMGQAHGRALGRSGKARLTAVADIDPRTARKVGEEFHVPYFTHHRGLIRSGLCDAVAIATPHPEHARPAIDALHAGLDVLCEKPLTERVSTADRLLQAAQASGRLLAVDFPLRCRPAFLQAREWVRGGRLGRLQRALLTVPEYRTQAYYESGGWRATWRGEGGGVLLNQAPHMLDIFLQLTGAPAAVYGRTETRLHAIEVEDTAEALLRFPGGATGYIHTSTNEPRHGAIIELCGDRGKLTWRGDQLECHEFSVPLSEHVRAEKGMWGKIEVRPAALPEVTPPSGIWEHFLDALHGRTELLIPGASGLVSLEVANAIALSSARGRWITLPVSRTAYDRFLAGKRRTADGAKAVLAQRITDPGLAELF